MFTKYWYYMIQWQPQPGIVNYNHGTSKTTGVLFHTFPVLNAAQDEQKMRKLEKTPLITFWERISKEQYEKFGKEFT